MRRFRFTLLSLTIFVAITALLVWGYALRLRSAKYTDPLLEAIEKRFGPPDRITGSGRMFIQYDLPNGDTLTLIVSGDRIISADIEHPAK